MTQRSDVHIRNQCSKPSIWSFPRQKILLSDFLSQQVRGDKMPRKLIKETEDFIQVSFP